MVLALALLAAGACGSDTDHDTAAGMAYDPAAPATATADGAASADAPAGGPAGDLDATLRRSRLFETQRSLGLLMVATGDADLRIGDIQLVTPLYETVPAPPATRPSRPGGDPRSCRSPTAPPSATPTTARPSW